MCAYIYIYIQEQMKWDEEAQRAEAERRQHAYTAGRAARLEAELATAKQASLQTGRHYSELLRLTRIDSDRLGLTQIDSDRLG
jgi:hypothetical protein